MELARAGAFTLVDSPAPLAEVERVVRRRKFYAILERSQTDARRIMREVTRLSDIVEAPALPAPVSRDSDDDRVPAVAVAGHADIVVSGDMDLLSLGAYENIPIVASAEAVRLIRV